MIKNLSVRQLLACLNVSVYADAVKPLLEKQGENHDLLLKNEQPLFFVFLLNIGMWGIALMAFHAFHFFEQDLWIGCVLVLLSSIGYFYNRSLLFSYFCWGYFLAGELLFLFALFQFSPAVTAFFALLFLLIGGRSERSPFRQVSTTLLFCFFLCKAFYQNSPETALDNVVILLSSIGFLTFVLPVKYLYWRQASVLFLCIPLVLLLLCQMLSLTGIELCAYSSRTSLMFCIEVFFLLIMLWKEMEYGERFFCLILSLLLLAIGYTVSPGLTGGAVVVFLAFFGDSKPLAFIGSGVMLAFFFVWLLTLPLSFGQAGWLLLLFSTVFFFLQQHLGKSLGLGKGEK